MCTVSIRKMFMMTGFLFLLFLVWVFFGAIVIQIYRDNLNWIDVVPYINQNVKKYDMWKINIIKKRHRKKMALIIFLSTFLTNDWHVLYCSSLIQRVFLLVKEKHYDDFYSPSIYQNCFKPIRFTFYSVSCRRILNLKYKNNELEFA